jgi:L-asparaginase
VSRFTLVHQQLRLPALVIHGGAGAYLKITSPAQRRARGDTLEAIVRRGNAAFATGGARDAVLAAIHDLECDPSFNAGYGSRLQRDGVARLSASLMDGQRTRMSAVYNVQECTSPSELASALQARPDRNLDGDGARLLMQSLGMEAGDVKTSDSIARWRKLIEGGDSADREAALGSADDNAVERARAERIAVPEELESIPDEDRHGTVGAVACDLAGAIWACTSTGGRGHEAVGRISDSPTTAGNYACPRVALSATGFGEQIIDLNVCGRIATRILDGASLQAALARTFEEIADFGGLLGVIAIGDDGAAAYAHTTEACGVAWIDATGEVHRDQHGR